MKEFHSLSIPRIVKGIMGDDLLKNHLEKLQGLTITTYIPEAATEAIIDFTYRGCKFSTNNGYLVWSFTVEEGCPEEISNEIVVHCEKLIKKLAG